MRKYRNCVKYISGKSPIWDSARRGSEKPTRVVPYALLWTARSAALFPIQYSTTIWSSKSLNRSMLPVAFRCIEYGTIRHLKSCQWFASCMHWHRWCRWVYCGASSGPSTWRVMSIVCRAPGFCACESCEWEICLWLLECTVVQGYAESGWSWTGAEPAEMIQKYSGQALLPTDHVLDETMLRGE